MKRVINFFMPKEDVFFDLLTNQAKVVCKAGTVFGKFLRDYDDLSLAQKKKRLKEIVKIEHEGDKLIRETIRLLNKSFITPIDREDIHRLTELLDDLIDSIDDISQKLLQYEIKEIPRDLLSLSAVSLNSLQEVHRAVSCLKKPDSISVHLRKIHDLEDEGDKIYYDAITALFKKEKNALEIIKRKDLYEGIEDLLDKTQDVARIVEGIVVKHA